MMDVRRSDRYVLLLLAAVAVCCVGIMIYGDLAEKKNAVNVDDGGMSDIPSDSMNCELRPFDPNTVDSITLLRYGLGAIQIHSLMGYRRHGGTFESPLAISKLYNWSDEDVDKVLDYIVIGEEYKKTFHYRELYDAERRMKNEHGRRSYESRVYDQKGDSAVRNGEMSGGGRKYDTSNKFHSKTKIDINTADTTLLRRIPGVGTSIANAIIRLRNRLGGFYSVEQLKDISYISPELYEWFEVRSKEDLHLININKATFQVLNAHPYISYDQTRDLLNYRRLYGDIKSKEALMDTGIFNKEEVERLAPYIVFGE